MFKVRIPVEVVVTYGAEVDVILSQDEYQEYIKGKDIKELVSKADVSSLYKEYSEYDKEFLEEELVVLWDESMPK
jgi:hypothetical protein